MTKTKPLGWPAIELDKWNQVNKSPFIPEADCLVIGTKQKVEWLIMKAIKIFETIPWTNIEVKMLWDEYLANWRRVLAINTNYWEFIDIETLEKVELFQKWTKKQIWVFHEKYKIWNKEFYSASFMWNDNKGAILCADSLELAKVTIWWKEKAIYRINSEQIINWRLIFNIETADWKNHIIIPKTMKDIDLRIKWTNEKIVWVYNKAKRFGNKKVQKVLCENWKVKWVDTKTLEEVDMKLDWTNIRIVEVLWAESAWMNILYKVEIDDKNWWFKRDSERQIVYIDTHTMEPLMYKWKYVTNIHRIDKNHISFNLNWATDIYTFETK